MLNRNSNTMTVKKNKTEHAQADPGIELDFEFKSIQTSCRNTVDDVGQKNYRTVYRSSEVSVLYVDTEWINRRFTQHDWEADVTVGLFYIEGEKNILVGEKRDKLVVPKEIDVCGYELEFNRDDLNDFSFREGLYRVQVVINGAAGISDVIYLMESHEQLADYFKLLDVGFDRCCEEDPEHERPHSFNALNIEGLIDVRFYFIAQNKLPREWVYEFVIHIRNEKGEHKATRVVKANNYATNQAGESLIFFVADLSGHLEDFWEKGSYQVEIECFELPVIQLSVVLGDEDVPYRFVEEIKALELQSQTENKGGQTGELQQKGDTGRSRLYQLVGLRKVKEELTRVFELAEFIKMRRDNGFNDSYPFMNMLFLGNSGTGKSTVAEIVGEEFAQLGVLESGRVHPYRREDFTRPGMALEESLIREAISKSKGGVLLVEDAHELYPTNAPNDPALQILGTLLSILENEKPPILTIIAGDREELQAIFDNIPEIKRIFPTQLQFDDYTMEELMEITRKILEKRQFRFTPEAEDKFADLLKDFSLSNDNEFANGHFIEEQLDDVTNRMAKRLMANRTGTYSREEMMEIREEDIADYLKPDPEKILEKLDEMVTSKQLRQSIDSYINYVHFLCERQKYGFTEAFPPLNMIFSGNPGTGKMTVAKMLGEVLESMRVLGSASVQVREYSDLVGDGSYPPQQFALYAYEQARGGILYIRETQNLLQDQQGVTALGAILGQLSETENGDTIVILGGIETEMEKLLLSNPRLKLVFPYLFHFEDYKPDELYKIALQKIAEKNYTVHPKAKEVIHKLVERIYRENNAYFGNALFIEKIIDKSIRNLSERTMKIRKERQLTRKEVTTLMAADIPTSASDMPNAYKEFFDEKEISAALKELDRMVGQKKLKKQIHDFVNLARHYNQQGVKLTTRLSLQWCFTGNSGMGKGTVARIIARLYKAMGLIERVQVYRFKAEKLIGLSEEEMSQGIGNALLKSKGGLFFFDEDSPRLNEVHGMKNRLRAILMNQMTQRPGSYTVIYANQNPPRQLLSDEVEQISDVINILNFEDYTKEELLEILKRDLTSENYRMTRTAQQHMDAFVSQLLENKNRSRVSARLIKLVAEMMIRYRIQRLTRDGEKKENGKVVTINKEDVLHFTPEVLDSLSRERKAIGY